MSEFCTCGVSYGETGLDGCPVIGKTPHNVIIVPRYAEDGTLNKINTNSATLGADIQALCQFTTPAQERLYPLPFGENFVITKSDTVYETGPSGNKYKIKEGIRTIAFELWDKSASVRMLAELKKFGCSQLAYYIVDIEGKLEGYKNNVSDADFYPYPMETSTYNAILMYATDSAVQKIMLSFDQTQYFNDGKIYYLTPSDLGYSATELKGLVPINSVVSNITTTGVEVALSKPAYSAIFANATPLTGLLLAQFSLYDVTGGAPVAITGVTEGPDGTYTLTYSAVAGQNDFELTIAANGYAIPVISYVDPA